VAAGKRPGSKTRSALFGLWRPALVACTMLLGSVQASFAESGPFTGMEGRWSGGGSVTLDDGSTERIRCRATYAVGANGNGLNQTLLCASDSYRFELHSNVLADRGAISGTWSEVSRNVSGSLQGRVDGSTFQVIAMAPGFTANIALTTRGNRQSVVIRADSQFKGASISLSRS